MRVKHRLTEWLFTTAGIVLLTGSVADTQPPHQEQDGGERLGARDPDQEEMQEMAKTFTAGQFEVGQRWEYDHEGPRPGAMDPNAINGKRILQVVSQTERDGQTLWVIEERFTNDPNVVGVLYVDNMGMLRSLDIANEKGEAARLTYERAIAYQAMEMEVGEQKLWKPNL